MNEWMTEQWLLAVAVRSVLVLLIAWLLAMVLRRSSAAVLYRIWFLGLMSCLILWPIGSILPQWKLGVLPAEAVTRVDNAMVGPSFDNVAINPYRPVKEAPRFEADVDAAGAQVPQDFNPEQIHEELTSQFASPKTVPKDTVVQALPSRPVSFASIAMAIWSVGVALFVARYVWHWNAARVLRQECRDCDDERWRQVAEQCSLTLRINRPVSLALHPSSISPMVIGILKPVVLLPESSNDWNPDRRRLVLMHELSHIQRNDLLSQFLAAFTCAIYWFNPLVWIAAGQMKKLREIACDDAVVNQTAEPELYAEVLLNVALAQRQRTLAGAIAMGRTNNVKGRIECILDSARHRNPLTRRWAVGLAMLAIAISVLIGTGSLTSRAQETKSEDAKTEEAKTDELTPDQQLKEFMKDPTTFEKKKMVIKVIDENGNPMPDALIHVSALDFFDKDLSSYAVPDVYTDAIGEADAIYTDPVPMKGLTPFPSMGYMPQIMEGLRISVSKVGYVPMYVLFDTTWIEDDESLPDFYEIQMRKGHRISGHIVDANGGPVVGAKVQVKIERDQSSFGLNPMPCYGPLAEGEFAAITNEDGAWEITNAPAQEIYADGFRLKINHPDYIGDKDWGELQKEQDVTTQKLRIGKALIKLKKGARLTGQVTDTQGNPITNGMIAWVLPSNLPWEPMKQDKTELLPIDPAGRYETGILRSSKYRVAVSAPGYTPQQREVDLLEDMQQANFSLQSGRRIMFRVVDSSGKQIPNATANVGAWRGFFCIYDVERLNQDKTGKYRGPMINIQPDEDGVFVWDSAPESKIQFFAGAEGYVYSRPLLAPSDDTQEIRLTRKPVIYGKVIDKTTGQPIKHYQVMSLHPRVTESMPHIGPEHISSENGEYRYGPKFDTQVGGTFRVRIEAAGYRTALGTKDVGVDDIPVQEDFALEPAAPKKVIVEDAVGSPVKKYSAIAHTALGINFGQNVDDKGQMSLEPTSEPTLLRVSADQGYAEFVWKPGEDLSTIRLQPWASVHGRLTQNGVPAAGERIRFARFPSPMADRYRDNYSSYDLTVTTDQNGYFRLDQLPPVSGHLCVDSNVMDLAKIGSSESIPLHLKPGVKTEVNLGSGGAVLSGKVVASGRRNDAGTNLWSLNYLIRRDWQDQEGNNTNTVSRPNPTEPMNFEWLKKTGFLQWNHYTDLTEFQRWFYRRPYYWFNPDKDGNFKIYGVVPGRYELLIQLYDKPAEGLVETVGQKIVPITITQAQVDAGSVSVGDIEIACRQGPRVGADMRALRYLDSSGTRRSLVDSQHGYVLVHVWAGWSEHCLEDLSMLVPLVKDFANEPISLIGFNIDKDPASAKALADKLKVQWPQNYVGERSDLMQQLAITTLPAYYLVGPDGKLIASTELRYNLQEMLKKQFRQ